MNWGATLQTPKAAQSLDSRGLNEADRLIDQLLKKAIKMRARSIHFEPQDTFVLVRCRVGEKLYPLQRFSKHLHGSLVGHLKKRAGLDRQFLAPQEGAFMVTLEKISYQVTVAAVPGVSGEQIVLYPVMQKQIPTSLEELGFWGDSLQLLGDFIAQSRGLLLITGDSSANELLVAALSKELQHPSITIAAIDPVPDPIDEPSISAAIALQLAVKRSPDVITIGSLRGHDMVTAALAASQNHLVIGIVTAPTPGTALALLHHWSDDKFLLARLLLGVVYQAPIELLPDGGKAPFALSEPQQLRIKKSFPALPAHISLYRRQIGLPTINEITPFNIATKKSHKTVDTTHSLTTNIVQVTKNKEPLQKLLLNEHTAPTTFDSVTSQESAISLAYDIVVKASAGVIDWKHTKGKLA